MNLKKELMNFLQSLDGDELRNLADGSLPEEMAVDAYIASCPTEKMKRPTINDYPQTDARTFKNLDGSVDWKKYAEALEEYADSLSPSPQPSATAEKKMTAKEWLIERNYDPTLHYPHSLVVDLLEEYAAKPVAEASTTTDLGLNTSSNHKECVCEIPDRESGYSYCHRCHRHVSSKRMDEIAETEDGLPNPVAERDIYKITDLRNYLLRHPDQEMVRASCLHYLGDKTQAVAEREVPEEEMGLRLYQASDYLCEADLTRYDCDKIVTWMRQEEKRQSIERNQ